MKQMRKLLCAMLAIALLLCLAACGNTGRTDRDDDDEPDEPDEPSVKEPSKPEPEDEKPAAPDEKELVRAARCAVAREYDKFWRECALDDSLLEEYYSGIEAQTSDSAVLKRARAVASVAYDAERFRSDGGEYEYLASILMDGEYTDTWLKLDIGGDNGASASAKERFITAELEDGCVLLTFDDTREAENCLRGEGDPDIDYKEYGRDYRVPGDDMKLGAGNKYEVLGLFSDYKALFIADLGSASQYLPYLFLVTDDNGLEMVNIADGFKYGVFCAMPVPGSFTDASLEKPTIKDDGGSMTAIVTDSYGGKVDLSECTMYASGALPWGGWSYEADGVTMSVDFSEPAYIQFSISNEYESTNAGFASDAIALGMTENGIVCGATVYDWEGTKTDPFAWLTDNDTLTLAPVIGGGTPFRPGMDGEILTLTRTSFGNEDYPSYYDPLSGFIGEWVDSVSGRCYLTIYAMAEPGVAYALIEWGDSAAETYVWEMYPEEGPEDEVALYYTACRHFIRGYDEDGNESVTEIYGDGTGSFFMPEPDKILWRDNDYLPSADCVFVPLAVPEY